MQDFTLCHDCQAEYENMADRRFHVEAMACSVCGPRDQQGTLKTEREDALQQVCRLVRRGSILGIKGLGGFQLWTGALKQERATVTSGPLVRSVSPC